MDFWNLFKQDPVTLIESEPAYFEQFSLVVVTELVQTSMAKSEKTCCMWLTLYLDSNNLTTHGIKTLRKAYPQAFSSWTGRHDYSSICEKFYNWSNWILSYWLMIRVFLKINTGMLKNRPKLNHTTETSFQINQRHKHD